MTQAEIEQYIGKLCRIKHNGFVYWGEIYGWIREVIGNVVIIDRTTDDQVRIKIAGIKEIEPVNLENSIR